VASGERSMKVTEYLTSKGIPVRVIEPDRSAEEYAELQELYRKGVEKFLKAAERVNAVEPIAYVDYSTVH